MWPWSPPGCFGNPFQYLGKPLHGAGKLTGHHRFLLKILWKELAQQEELIAELDAKIEEHTRPFAAEIERLDAIPGADRRVAEVLLAEVGPDMKPFPSDEHIYLPGRGCVRAMKRAPGSGEGGASRRATAGSRKP